MASRSTGKSASGAGSTEIPAGRQPNPIIHRVAETLFAAQVPLRRLHRDMPKKELNLLQLAAGLMAKTGTSPTKVVRRERLDLTSLRFLLHDTPNDLGAESVTPNPASLVDRTKERAGCNSGGRHPDVNSSFHPVRNRDGSYVAALADKIGDDPMLLFLLYVFNAQCSQFRSAETATQQNGQCGIVSLTSKACTVWRQQ
ncbi:MAG TPA: hypothetical protein VK638_49825 [Edaphobacter sp.]|nr:hypothetical protein [Edaphobacter sp.]